MSTIDATYFFGQINIAQKSEVSITLLMFIENLEEELLTKLLGYKLYKEYKAGIGVGTPDPKWTAIRDGKEYTDRSSILTKWRGLIFSDGANSKKSLIANYVYWHWMENEVTISTGTGEKVANNQNASDASPAAKMVSAWNQMVYWNWELVEFLLSNPTDYPDFIDHYGRIPVSILKKQNVLGI